VNWFLRGAAIIVPLVSFAACGPRARTGEQCSLGVCLAVSDAGQCYASPPVCCDGVTPACSRVASSMEEVRNLPVSLVKGFDAGECIPVLADSCGYRDVFVGPVEVPKSVV